METESKKKKNKTRKERTLETHLFRKSPTLASAGKRIIMANPFFSKQTNRMEDSMFSQAIASFV